MPGAPSAGAGPDPGRETAEDWFGGRRQVVVADTSLRTRPEPYPWPWALPPVVLLAATAVTGAVAYPGLPARIPVHFGTGGAADRYAATSLGSAFEPLIAQAVLTALMSGLAWAAVRSSPRLDAEADHAAERHRRPPGARPGGRPRSGDAGDRLVLQVR